ncbi:MAG: hypothetical protein JNJ85_11265 [Candidatus Kapabacteria bacterium]|nr:hypothetical protein [Candidatus Kapabacteria bacterium]
MNAQAGNRLYLRFGNNDDEVWNTLGCRIKPDNLNRNYWVLGSIYDHPISPSPTALAFLPFDLTSTLPPIHKHILTANSLNGNIGFGADFTLLPNNNITVIGNYLLQVPKPPAFNATSLFTVDPNINLIGSSNDYDMNLHDDWWGPMKQNNTPGNSIVFDNFANTNNYYCAFHAIDPNTVGNGTNLSDWGVASINSTTMAVNWEYIWGGTDALQDERIHCMKQTADNYLIMAGARRDYTNNKLGGLVTKVDAITGNLSWQVQYNPPNGYAVVFNCISTVTKFSINQYIVTGIIYPPANSGLPRSMIAVGINPNGGAVMWSWQYALTNGDDVEAYHHYTDDAMHHGIVVAGTVYHGAEFYRTSGMLMELENWSLNTNKTCSELMVWSRLYDTKNVNHQLVNTSLVDVTRSLNSENEHDFTAIGTAEVIHHNQQIKDVLVLETAPSPITGTPGWSYSRDNDYAANIDHCLTTTPTYSCEYFGLDTVQLHPTKVDKFTDRKTELINPEDNPYRICYANGGPNDLFDAISQKRAKDDEILKGDNIFETLHIKVSPLPVNLNSALLTYHIPNFGTHYIKIYDVNGILVKNFQLPTSKPGIYQYELDCSELNSSIYMLKIQSEAFSQSIMFPVVK